MDEAERLALNYLAGAIQRAVPDALAPVEPGLQQRVPRRGGTHGADGAHCLARGALREYVPGGEQHEHPQRGSAGPRTRLIEFISDRPGHDYRYAIDASKIQRELGWSPSESFDTGLRKTVEWYIANPQWIAEVTSGGYRQWIETHYTK